MNLQEFLNKNKVKGLTKEIVLADRFRDENGKLLKFKIKTITRSEYEEIQAKTKKIDENGNIYYDSKFETELIISGTVYPNFKDAESMKEVGAKTAAEYVEEVLLLGESARLLNEISAFSGFNSNINDLIEESKN